MNTNIKKVLNRKQTGFTLIEILVVIGMIALLAAIVIIAINPARQFAQGRNTQRTSNVSAILNAIGQRMADNKGVLNCADDIPLSTLAGNLVPNPITNANWNTFGAEKISDVVATDDNLAPCLTPTYISALPFDPSADATNGYKWVNDTDYDTGYYVVKDVNGRVTVFAPKTDLLDGKIDYIAITR